MASVYPVPSGPSLRPPIPRVWTIVLAAGAGKRLASVTGGVPKQFWRRDGGSTLLEHTLDRLNPIAPASRTVVVAAEQHRAYIEAAAESLRDTHVIYQSRDRGTAAGVALGLLPVLDQDPDAIVVVTPCDHGVGDLVAFREGLSAAIQHVAQHDGIVLGGVEPSGATDDYGWIVPCPQNGTTRLRPVMAFHEKPDRLVASALYSAGAVWNTMVTVARARTLFGVYREQVPDLAGVFVRALRMRPADRPAWLTTAYESLTPVDFSRDLMATAMGLTAYVWPTSIGWSDLGTPARLSRWLDSRGTAAPSRHPSADRPVRAAAQSADSREHPVSC